MLNIAVCDDDIKFTGKMETLLLAISEKEHIVMEIDVFLDGRELVDSVIDNKKCYDLIFMDVEMKMNGITTAKVIRMKDDNVLLIYVTSHTSYAMEAYEVQPFQFMEKPIRYKKLYQYFLKAYSKIVSDPSYYIFKYEKHTYRILIPDIMYFLSKKRVVYIYLNDGTSYKYYDKLNNIEVRMKKGKVDFWRIHQSCLVSSKYIYRMSKDVVELKSGKILSISEDRRKLVTELYCDSIGDEIID